MNFEQSLSTKEVEGETVGLPSSDLGAVSSFGQTQESSHAVLLPSYESCRQVVNAVLLLTGHECCLAFLFITLKPRVE